jgi:hypothetical protein
VGPILEDADQAGPDDNKYAYVFERAAPFPNPDGTTTIERIDVLAWLSASKTGLATGMANSARPN